MKKTNYYLLLGVSSRASLDEIKAAYRKKIRQIHPDTGAQDDGVAAQLNLAYETLKDPIRRQKYDKQLRMHTWYMLGQKGQALGKTIKSNLKDNLFVLKENLTPPKPKPNQNTDEHLTVFVYPWQAALGDKITVQTTHHRILVPIAAFATTQKLKITGAGLQRDDGSFGDLYLTVCIQNPNPDALTDAQKTLFAALQQQFARDNAH